MTLWPWFSVTFSGKADFSYRFLLWNHGPEIVICDVKHLETPTRGGPASANTEITINLTQALHTSTTLYSILLPDRVSPFRLTTRAVYLETYSLHHVCSQYGGSSEHIFRTYLSTYSRSDVGGHRSQHQGVVAHHVVQRLQV